MTPDEIWLGTIIKKNGIPITDIQLSLLGRYVNLLREWNKRINLISRRDEENIWVNHILLSLAFLIQVDFPSGFRVLDLGTGGGLPGIPLGIMLPEVNFVLLDSINKKVRAVQEMVNALGLSNVSTICSRAEEAGVAPAYKNLFDAVIARSVSGLENLAAWGFPFLKPATSSTVFPFQSGKRTRLIAPAIITLKGGELEKELGATKMRFPKARVGSTDLAFYGSEILQNQAKKFVIVENG
ncbi:MAG TPA: 16S rRNA (guanine(527)-N(7))-methyltransferase RsmG [Bacteroidota bacterium]|nr:16S rRNA (guanine(527)-N(7))-methyltransferase RsmG [Bacteroidota bacterium]